MAEGLSGGYLRLNGVTEGNCIPGYKEVASKVATGFGMHSISRALDVMPTETLHVELRVSFCLS